MKRLFAGIRLRPDENLSEIYEGLQEDLAMEKIKWVEAFNIHLTLWFFGNVEDREIPGISESLRAAAGRNQAFNLTINGIGYFGRRKTPDVIWLGTDLPGELKNLAMDVHTELIKLGYEKQDHDFNPHITLGRIKFIKDPDNFHQVIDEFKNVTMGVTFVKEFFLIESVLGSQGPKYYDLKTFTLQK